MNCPDPARIADLVNGVGTPRDLEALRQHLYGCSDCASVAAAVVSSSWSSRSLSATASEVEPGLAARPIPVGTRLGRYQIRCWLGRGGMGDVYEGYDPELDRRVALKLLRLRGGDDESAQQRLGREARVLARLASPNVVAALDVGRFGERLFLVMELVEGPTLAGWLSLAPRDWHEVLQMFLGAGEGLAAAHEVGVIHGDFKPQNVLIGADGRPRVSDFGLARETVPEPEVEPGSEPKPATTGDSRAATDTQSRADRTMGADTIADDDATRVDGGRRNHTGHAAGTPRYMAPEQFVRGSVDARVDQFSFCVALHEALYGVHPFKDRALLVDGAARSPRHTHPPRALSAVLRRGLSRDPADRFVGFRDLLAELRRAATSRRRATLGIAALAGLTAMAVAGAITWNRTRHANEPDVVVEDGEPADWTSSRVLTRVADTIHCLQRLDERTLRMVWGDPHRAEDIDVGSGARRPTDLVPESYRAGCPTLSPDGKQILFEGYDADGRPQMFHAGNATGRNAKAIVSCAKASASSEPIWLPSGQRFVFDLDFFHPAVYDLERGSFAVLPDRDRVGARSISFFKALAPGSRIVITEQTQHGRQSVSAYRWPGLALESSFVLSTYAADAWRGGASGEHLYGVGLGPLGEGIGRLELRERTLTHLAVVRGRVPFYVQTFDGRLVFATRRATSEVWNEASGQRRKLLDGDSAIYDSPSLTSRGDVLLVRVRSLHSDVVLVDRRTGALRAVADAVNGAVAALPGGEWTVAGGDPTGSGKQGVFRCTDLYAAGPARCTQIASAYAVALAASPQGNVLAYTAPEGQGLAVHLVTLDAGEDVVLAHDATECRPVWSDARRLWVSLHTDTTGTWTEFDATTRRPTGRSLPGQSSCFDFLPDPGAPSNGPIRIVTSADWDVRIHDEPAN